MIGRDAEIVLLSGMIAESQAGRGGAVAVFGEAGIGKSALLAEVARGVPDDALVLRATGVEAESELPFAALHLLLRPARHLIAGLPTAQRAALLSAFGEGPTEAHPGERPGARAHGRSEEPVEAPSHAPAEVPPDGPVEARAGAPDRFLVGLAVLTLLADLAEERPLLCLLDDVQWLDRASLDALVFAARRLAAERITMIFAGRDGAEPAVNGLPELRLAALDRPDCERLLAGHAAGLTAEARDRVIEEAEGNPLALLHFSGILTPEQRAGHLAPLPLQPPGPSLTGRLEQSLRAAVRRLPERTRLLLLVAAADGSGSLRLVLKAAQALGAGPEDLEPGEHAALIEVSGDRLRFRHPLVKAAAYQEASLARRTAVHRALAGALGGDDQADRRAWHLSAAALEPDEEISAILAAAGARAAERGSNASAATAYERAAQLTVDRERRARRLAAAAQAALGAGQLPRAAAAAERGRRLTADPLVLARLASVRAAVEAEQGDPAPAAHLLIAAAEGVALIAPAEAASLLATAAGDAWFAGDRVALSRAADLLESLGTAKEPVGTDKKPLATDAGPLATDAESRPPNEESHPTGAGPRVDGVEGRLAGVVAAVRGMERVAAGDPVAGVPLLRAALPAVDVTDRIAGTYAVFGALMTGDDDAACERAEARVDDCRRRGLVGALPHALQLLTQAQILRGRHAEAAESGAEAWRIAHDTGQAGRLRHLHGILARLAAVRGEDEECRRLAAQAEGTAQERNGSGWGGCALTLLDLVRARYEAAAERMARILDGPLGHTVIVTFAIADHVEACARLNRPDRAAEAFARFDAWAGASGQPWAAAVAYRCRALLAARGESEAHYDAALALHARGGRPFEQARTRLLYGEWLRRARRRADAGTQLRAALEGFTALGAAPWAERARTELAAAGVHAAEPKRAAGSAALGTLTPQELQVVRLAAAGATNRQIGAQLFLSPRTVGFHLYKAYPKLGVSSRAELAGIDLGPPA
ncbi:helix-turn-helix transcriptional regulator [Nonomuraea sp. KM90]|uniref:helix-turn-helix transcriptional regulator n=1 Tax=Nonomuraea sp. KM90 TaxID=3457428 RepID=UPI003FCCD3EC